MENEFVKIATASDIKILAELANELWPENSLQDLIAEFSELIKSENTHFIIKYFNGEPVGFAQCQLRHNYVEGTTTSPVGYLEGIYIKSEYRHKGYASQLLSECEIWSVSKGCKEFASDCELDNVQSLKFHLASGFEEVNRIICFKKEL